MGLPPIQLNFFGLRIAKIIKLLQFCHIAVLQ